MRFPLQIIQCPFRKKETVAVVVHKISELVLCKDRIFTNITPQVFTLTLENSVVEPVVVSKQEYQQVRFDTTTFYMLIIIRLSHLLPALAFLDFADRQSAYPSPCLCFSLFVQHRASGLLPLFLHCRKCRA